MKAGHRRDNDAPKADRAHKRYIEELARGVLNIDRYVEEIQEARPTLVGVKVRCDVTDEMGVLVILTGYEGSKAMVAFHRDITVSAALQGVGNRLRNGSLKWRVDQYG